MKILILNDFNDSWSVHNRSKALAKHLPQHQFTIRAENELGPGEQPRLWGAALRAMPRAQRDAYRRNPPQRQLWCVRDADQFDIVHFNFTSLITDYRDFLLEHRDRCLITLVNERAWFEGFGVDGRFQQLMRICPWKTAVSKRVADAAGATYIPNGVDFEIFSEPRRPVVGYAGTSAQRKNGHLVKAACHDLGLELRTAIYAGDTPNQPIPHERMPEWYRGLDVYVHASETEGCNNTVLEALACGVPVLMTRVGCWQEFEGVAEFIEPTVKSIKAGLQKWCGRRLISDKFQWKHIAQRYEERYVEIARESRVRERAAEVCGGAPA